MTYFDGDRFLNGPRLAAWIETEFPDFRSIAGSGAARRVSAWRSGIRADIYSLDRILVALAAHPSDIPAECWEADQRRSPSQTRSQAPNGKFVAGSV